MPTEYEIPTWKTEMRQLGPNVYAYFQEKGSWGLSNAGLIVGKDCCVVIDSLSTVKWTQAFLAEIQKVTDKPVRYLINTHYHGDHILGNHLFPGSISICHTNCREQTLKLGEEYNPAVRAGNQAYLSRMFSDRDLTGTKMTPQDITFDRDLTLYLDDRRIHLIHYQPGHTIGDIIVWLPQDRILFAGDLLFLYSTPVTWEGSFSGWIETLQALAHFNAGVYVPGHGPYCGKEGVFESRDYLVRVYDLSRKKFDAGMGPFDAARKMDLGNYRKWACWERILANVESLYREFRGGGPLSVSESVMFFRSDFGKLRAKMNELRESA